MIKFAKYMYGLGLEAAFREVLSEVDKMANPEPHDKGVVSQTVYYERETFKRHMHQLYDPNYEPFNFKDIERLMKEGE